MHVAGEEIKVRPAFKEEADAIGRLLREAFAEFATDYTPEAFAIVTPSADEIARRFDEGPIWVAVKDNKIVATVSSVPESEWLYIRSMAVLPQAQGLGIARKMLEAVEEYAIESGFERLFLYTTHFSKEAIRLYEKNGFERGRDTSADEWYGTPGLAMEKKIGRNITQNAIGS